ncbi:MAG: biotin--[acetyl-CoA-carboxylase] ligase, partial [Chloroflexales bacterium]|nr:biotin--[acetyl-CoA-carboxylase] ligase [Chloroflexales bacterium]
APPGSALLLSLLLRPRWLAPERAFALTMLAATSLCAAVEATTGLRPTLKWPNDVLLAQAKVAGILAELHIHVGAIDWAVIGIGVNVRAHPPPDQTRYPATSLDAALSGAVNRLRLLRALLRQLDAGYGALRADGYDALFADWRAHLATLGQAVRVATPAGLLKGTAVDVTPAGALLVRAADGVLHTVTTGDVQA